MKKILCLISLFLLGVTLYASPITGLLERIDKGASRKFVIERLKGEKDFFELDYKHCNIFILQMLAFCSGGLVKDWGKGFL